MGRIATLSFTLLGFLTTACGTDPAPKTPVDTGDPPVVSDDTSSPPPDDSSAPPDDDTGEAEDLCRNLVILPPAVLLDSSASTRTSTSVTLLNDCAEEAAPLEISALILADESGSFSIEEEAPYVLESGIAVSVELAFEPLDGETRTAFAIVISNDPDNPNASISMVGRPPADVDGDGFIGELGGGDDCDDSDPLVYPGGEDTWYDGVDGDCAGNNDFDADADGHMPIEWGGGDCDDTDAAVYPGATDLWYDGTDSDCGGEDDYDFDGDGYQSSDYGGTDCDDDDPELHPGMEEIFYDGIDTDCDGLSDYDADVDGHDAPEYGGDDCDDDNSDICPSCIEIIDDIDNDCDLIVDEETDGFDDDGDGYSEADGDCDDTNPGVNPGAIEVCSDGLDNNCDGFEDEEGALDCSDWYIDGDGDGYGGGDPRCLCASDEEYNSPYGTDCDDASSVIGPDAADAWYDGVDTDCDGWSDYDADRDGHDGIDYGGADCDDSTDTVHPDVEETYYDGLDSNCDGWSDFDADHDGHDGLDYGGSDCDDLNPDRSPTTPEVRDLLDQDCDEWVDEDFVVEGDVIVSEIMVTPLYTSDWDGEYFELFNTTDFPIDLLNWSIVDADDVGFTVTDSLVIEAGDYVVMGVNDNPDDNGGVAVDYVYDHSIFNFSHEADVARLSLDDRMISAVGYSRAWGVEVGASIGVDPDFADDATLTLSSVWCSQRSTMASSDYGTPGEINDSCLETDWDGDGFTELDGDCDDWNLDIHPMAEEACDGFDNDCDGDIDEGAAIGAAYWYYDGDGDGFGDPYTSFFLCEPLEGFVGDSSDCDDMDASRNPLQVEVWYDGVDTDCDGWSDFDADFDEYDSSAHEGSDCDDSDASVNPGMIDDWYDGVDADCGGEDDYDSDGDGYRSDSHDGSDCNDEDPYVNPATPEAWNGIDDNCVGGIDDFMVMGFSTMVIAADSAIHLGYESGISTGDFNDDGTPDLAIGADQGGYYAEGMVWLLDGSEPWGLVGTPMATSYSRISGSAAGNYLGAMGPKQVDLIAGSAADLVVAGTDALDGHAMCLFDGAMLDGPQNCTDAYATWVGADDDYPHVVSHLDYNGDGVAGLFYADSWSSASDTGKVYAFSGAEITPGEYDLLTDNDWRIDGRHAYDYVGSQLSGADINADGYDDLFIGAYGDDHPHPKTGSVFVFLGGAESTTPVRTAQFDKDAHIYGSETNAMVGRYSPSAVSDVNGDGSNDFIVSSPGSESVHVFFDAGLLVGGGYDTDSADVSVYGTEESDWFGMGMAVSDLDGDGFSDLTIGAPDESSPGSGAADSEGHVYIFFGAEIETSTMTADDAGAHFRGRANQDNFGALIRSGFDMNLDGRDDLAISAPGNTLTTTNAGQVHLLLMPPGR